jgi:tetratricopeptide (TPR) repeat protein
MDTYIDKLAPWEMRNAYYEDVKLGKEVNDLIKILKNQTEVMIATQIDSADEIVSSQGITEETIQEIGYGIKDVGQGMSGLKAAFEWGISDVVWCVEKETEELRDVMMAIYRIPDGKMDQLQHKADDAFARGDMADAMEIFAEIESLIEDDFSVCISYGMIYLFHNIDKEKALVCFDRAIKCIRPYSTYYTSYALLYKALIKRDFGFIEEAEKCTSEAIELSPGFAEAMYQNAQYNVLLNRPEKAIPLLKKAIKEDIFYCLKILWEHDFKHISSEIAELFEGIRKDKNDKVKESLEEVKKNVTVLTNAVKGIEKLGHDVPQESTVELLEEGNNEIDILIKNNSIFDAYFAGTLLPLLSKKINRQKEILRKKGNELHINLDRQIQDLSAGVSGKKKNGGTLSFLIHFLCGQIVALPFGWFIGVPLGICITEGLLLAVCFYINVILPQSQWEEIDTKQNEQEKLLRIMRKL